jgi:hypothetical protein
MQPILRSYRSRHYAIRLLRRRAPPGDSAAGDVDSSDTRLLGDFKTPLCMSELDFGVPKQKGAYYDEPQLYVY